MCSLGMLVLVLSSCDTGVPTGRATGTGTASAAPTWTPAPSPSATSIPPGLASTPTDVPDGWQVYATAHFSIAYPADWIVQVSPNSDGGTNYEFEGSNGAGRVQVAEADHVDAAIVSSVCTSNDEKVTFAGLPMFYSAENYGRTQLWEFATSNATYYLLQTTDASNDPGIQASDKSILATFRPDDMTSGCS